MSKKPRLVTINEEANFKMHVIRSRGESGTGLGAQALFLFIHKEILAVAQRKDNPAFTKMHACAFACV